MFLQYFGYILLHMKKFFRECKIFVLLKNPIGKQTVISTFPIVSLPFYSANKFKGAYWTNLFISKLSHCYIL